MGLIALISFNYQNAYCFEFGGYINIVLGEILSYIALMISDYYNKGMLFWKRGSVFVLAGKERRLCILCRVMWIR